MTSAIFAAPAAGREVRFPSSMLLLPDDGMNVPDDDLFWARRFRDQDVIVLEVRWDNAWPPSDAWTDWDNGTTVWDVGASGGIGEAPTDGRLYPRQGSTSSWAPFTGGGGGGGGQPANVGAPSVTPTGTASIGTLLTCSTGSWTNAPLGYSYQWQHNGVNITGATSLTYTVEPTDVGGPLICNVTAVNSAGPSAPASSNAISVFGPPINTALPSILGANSIGTTLTCTSGSWTNSPTFAYQWTREGADLATGPSYTLLSGDASHLIGCIVTATNGSGSNAANAPPLLIQGPPVNTVVPTISGTALIKQVLTVSDTGTWLGAPTFTYQWQHNGVNIAGASGPSYETIYIDGAATITRNVTGHNSFGTAMGTSNGVAIALPFSFPAGAVGIYSTRLAVAAYGLGGHCMRVTRWSDNATSDIGFNQFGDFDIATALGFAGGSTLSVAIWYDQSGSGNNLTQPTIVGAQPEVLPINGQPYLAFNQTNIFCNLTSASPTPFALTGDQTIGGVFQLNTPISAAVPISCFDNTNGWFLGFSGAGKGSAGYVSSGSGGVNDSSNLLSGSVHRVGVTRNAGSLSLMVDGVQTATSSGVSNAASTAPLLVGSLAAADNHEGLIGEVYIYPSVQSLNAIQTSEAAYFPATGFQNYYNGAHAFQPSAGTQLLFGNKLQYEYTQPWTMFAQIQCYSHLGEEAEAAIWSNIYHAVPFIGYIVAVALNTSGLSSPFPPGVINCPHGSRSHRTAYRDRYGMRLD